MFLKEQVASLEGVLHMEWRFIIILTQEPRVASLGNVSIA